MPEPERSVLGPAFFNRDTVAVARELVGANLCRRIAPRRVIRARITETEAYDGPEDRACHASKGETQRTTVMFGPPGVWYVYLCYGVHWMLNVVTREKGFPAAVLIRGCDRVSGPGRLTRELAIGRADNAIRAARARGLWIERGPGGVPDDAVATGPRVGIGYAGEPWTSIPWRFRWRAGERR